MNEAGEGLYSSLTNGSDYLNSYDGWPLLASYYDTFLANALSKESNEYCSMLNVELEKALFKVAHHSK